MRIQGPHSAAVTRETQGARRSSAGGFSLGHAEDAKAQSAAPGLRNIGGIDALLALQGVDDAAERRRRAATRGRAALDVLDELKAGLLGGVLDPGILGRLKAMAAGLQSTSGDGRLDGILAEINLRIEVEIAKMSPRAA